MPQLVVPNDSFEVDTALWAANGAGVSIERIEDATAPDRDASLKVNIGGGWEGIGGVRSDSIDVAPSTKHSFKLWVKAPVGRTVFPAISERNSGDTQVTFHEDTEGIEGTGEWMLVEHEATFGGTGVKARVFLRVDGVQGAGSFYVDADPHDPFVWRVGAGAIIATDGSAPGANGVHANTKTGDLLIWHWYSRTTGTNEVVTWPEGWTQIFQYRDTSGGLIACAWRIRQGGDSTYTATRSNHATGSSGETILSWIETFRDFDPSSPIGGFSSAASTWSSSTTLGPIKPESVGEVPAGGALGVFAGRKENLTAQTLLSGDSLSWIFGARGDTSEGSDAGAVTQFGINASGSSQSPTEKSIATTGTAQVGKGAMYRVNPLPPEGEEHKGEAAGSGTGTGSATGHANHRGEAHGSGTGTGSATGEVEGKGGSSSPYLNTVLAESSLVTCLPLDEASGDAIDVQGVNDGKPKGGLTRAQPSILPNGEGASTVFNGSTGWFEIPNHVSLGLGDTFSIEAWIKPAAVGGGSNYVIYGGQSGAPQFYIRSDETMQLDRRGKTALLGSVGKISKDTVYHVVVTKNGSERKMYVNAVDDTALQSNAAVESPAGIYALGRDAGASASFFNGAMQYVALYDIALSPETIEAHYEAAFVEPEGETHKGEAHGSGAGSGSATGARVAHGEAHGSAAGTGAATGYRTGSGSAHGQGVGTGSATGRANRRGSAHGSGAGTGSATGFNASIVDLVLPNGSFEHADISAWLTTGAGTSRSRVTDADAPDGKHILEVQTALEGWEGIGGVRTASIDAEPGRQYRVRCLARMSEHRTLYMAISERDGADSQIEFHEDEAGIDGVGLGLWQIVEFTAQFTTGVKARAYFRMDGPTEPDDPVFWIDLLPDEWPKPYPALRMRNGFEAPSLLDEFQEAQEIDGGECLLEVDEPIAGKQSFLSRLPSGARRAELAHRFDKVILNAGDEVWRAYDFYFPEGSDPGQLGEIMQFKQADEVGPGPIMLGVHTDTGRLIVHGGPAKGVPHKIHWWGPHVDDLGRGRGNTHRVILHALFSNDPEVGFVEIWLDGEQQNTTLGNGTGEEDEQNNGGLTSFWQTFTDVEGDYIYPKVGAYNDGGAEADAEIVIDNHVLSFAKADVFPRPPRIAVTREYPPTDLYFILRDPNTGAPIARWALDDPHAHNLVSGIHLRGQLPGGKKEATGVLPRDPRLRWSDLVKYANVEVCGPGREVYWSGRFNKAPKIDGERMSITGVCSGWQAALEDNRAVIGPGYIDPILSKWGEPSTARRKQLSDLAYKLVASTSVGHSSANLEAVMAAIINDFNGVTTGEGSETGEAHYYSGGVNIGKIIYDYRQLSSFSKDTDWESNLATGTSDTSFVAGVDHDRTTALQQVVTAPGPGYHYARVRDRYAGSASGELRDVTAWQPRVIGLHDLDLQGAWPDIGYFAKQILLHMIPLIAPPLEVNPEAIDDDDYVITSAWFSDPAPPAEKVREVCKFSPYLDWFVRRGRLFERRRAGTYGHRWYVRRAEFTEEGEDGERLWESITGRFTGVDGRTLMVGPPGSGAHIESELLQITDPDHPAVKAPVTRRDLLDFQGVTEPQPAIEACAEFLREANELSRSGQVTIPGMIQDEGGGFYPPSALQEGDHVFFPEALDRSGRKVVDYDYDDDRCAVVASLDAPPEALQALQERYRATLIPLGVG